MSSKSGNQLELRNIKHNLRGNPGGADPAGQLRVWGRFGSVIEGPPNAVLVALAMQLATRLLLALAALLAGRTVSSLLAGGLW